MVTSLLFLRSLPPLFSVLPQRCERQRMVLFSFIFGIGILLVPLVTTVVYESFFVLSTKVK